MPIDPADLHAFLRGRRSVRRFRPEPVPDETIRRLLDTAIQAPSAHNDQPWRFAVVREQDSRVRLAAEMSQVFESDLTRQGIPADEITARLDRSRRRILETPVLIVLCLDDSGRIPQASERREQAEARMTVQSAALAGLQLLLAAHAEGLGGVWTCGPLFAPDAVRAALDLPEAWQPQAMLLLGWPAETPGPRQIRPAEEITQWR